jgi:hypothetical protein
MKRKLNSRSVIGLTTLLMLLTLVGGSTVQSPSNYTGTEIASTLMRATAGLEVPEGRYQIAWFSNSNARCNLNDIPELSEEERQGFVALAYTQFPFGCFPEHITIRAQEHGYKAVILPH